MFKLPKDNFVFLETNRFDKDNRRSYLFSNPVKIIACYKPEDIRSAFLELEACISKGRYAAGFISYEAGFSFEENLKGLGKKSFFPLMWFGVYKKPAIFTHREKMDLLQRKNLHYAVENLHPSIAREEYIDNIEKIKDFIRRGDTYQVNYTFKYKFNFSGSAFDFYEDLKARQSVSYSALIKTRDYSLLSLSPELFFRKNKDRIEVRPMKGTIDRGRNLETDRLNAQILKNSLKNRSENVMIVDLLRSDLGRISRAGTVRTKKLFEVERYETLLQMTSVVRSVLKKDIALYDLFRAIFPSGSVTGAPKISTMKIINSLETEPRGVYTGGVGFFAPNGEAVFNVAIRTVLIDNKTRKAEMGIGSGIVYDSDPNKEFDECKLKADFITKKKTDFKLIETMLWRPEKNYFLLGLHLGRVLSSAEYFNFKYDRKVIIKKLKALEKQFKRGAGYRVRLLLNRDGKVEVGFVRINKILEPAKAGFSDKKTSSVDIFLYHKTTNRDLYNEEHKRWRNKGYFDIIFTNEKNQITEGAISNIIIKKGRFFYTPPLECGLLNGVFRKHLLKNRRFPVKERILYKDDIKKADEIYMANSVRGMVRVKI